MRFTGSSRTRNRSPPKLGTTAFVLPRQDTNVPGARGLFFLGPQECAPADAAAGCDSDCGGAVGSDLGCGVSGVRAGAMACTLIGVTGIVRVCTVAGSSRSFT